MVRKFRQMADPNDKKRIRKVFQNAFGNYGVVIEDAETHIAEYMTCGVGMPSEQAAIRHAIDSFNLEREG